jgi:hypothetical protein
MLKNRIRGKCPYLMLRAVMMPLLRLGSVHGRDREPEKLKKNLE